METIKKLNAEISEKLNKINELAIKRSGNLYKIDELRRVDDCDEKAILALIDENRAIDAKIRRFDDDTEQAKYRLAYARDQIKNLKAQILQAQNRVKQGETSLAIAKHTVLSAEEDIKLQNGAILQFEAQIKSIVGDELPPTPDPATKTAKSKLGLFALGIQ